MIAPTGCGPLTSQSGLSEISAGDNPNLLATIRAGCTLAGSWFDLAASINEATADAFATQQAVDTSVDARDADKHIAIDGSNAILSDKD